MRRPRSRNRLDAVEKSKGGWHSGWEKVRDETGGRRAQISQMLLDKPRDWFYSKFRGTVAGKGSGCLSLTSPPHQA